MASPLGSILTSDFSPVFFAAEKRGQRWQGWQLGQLEPEEVGDAAAAGLLGFALLGGVGVGCPGPVALALQGTNLFLCLQWEGIGQGFRSLSGYLLTSRINLKSRL